MRGKQDSSEVATNSRTRRNVNKNTRRAFLKTVGGAGAVAAVPLTNTVSARSDPSSDNTLSFYHDDIGSWFYANYDDSGDFDVPENRSRIEQSIEVDTDTGASAMVIQNLSYTRIWEEGGNGDTFLHEFNYQGLGLFLNYVHTGGQYVDDNFRSDHEISLKSQDVDVGDISHTLGGAVIETAENPDLKSGYDGWTTGADDLSEVDPDGISDSNLPIVLGGAASLVGLFAIPVGGTAAAALGATSAALGIAGLYDSISSTEDGEYVSNNEYKYELEESSWWSTDTIGLWLHDWTFRVPVEEGTTAEFELTAKTHGNGFAYGDARPVNDWVGEWPDNGAGWNVSIPAVYDTDISPWDRPELEPDVSGLPGEINWENPWPGDPCITDDPGGQDPTPVSQSNDPVEKYCLWNDDREDLTDDDDDTIILSDQNS